MNQTLKLRILIFDNSKPGEFRELYRNFVLLDSALSFVYQKVVDAFYLFIPRGLSSSNLLFLIFNFIYLL